jgi:hypothetical protein
VQELESEITDLSEAGKVVHRKLHSPLRDETMVENIRKLYCETDSMNMVIVVGLGHLYPLKKRLIDLNPVTLTLAEYDKI